MAMFQQYQGGIQPVTGMAEAGANIGNMYARGISAFGTGLAEGLKKYQENVEKNEILNAEGEQLGNEIMQFAKMFGDNPEYQAFSESLTPDVETLSKLSSMSLNQKQGAITGIKARFSKIGNQLTAYEMIRKSNLERDIGEAERRAKKTYRAADPRGIQAGKWDFDPTKSIGEQEQEFAFVLDGFKKGGITVDENLAYNNLYDQWERSISADNALPPEVRSAVLDQLAAARRDRQAEAEGYGEGADPIDYIARYYQTGEHYQTGYSSGQPSGLVSPAPARPATGEPRGAIGGLDALSRLLPSRTASAPAGTPTPAPTGLPAPASARTTAPTPVPAPARSPASITPALVQPAPEPAATSTPPVLPTPPSATRTEPVTPAPALPPPPSAESKPKSKKKQSESDRLGVTAEQLDDAQRNKQRALRNAQMDVDTAIMNRESKSKIDALKKEHESIKSQGLEFFLNPTEDGAVGETGAEGTAGETGTALETPDDKAVKEANQEFQNQTQYEQDYGKKAIKDLQGLNKEFINNERIAVGQIADWVRQEMGDPSVSYTRDTKSKTILNKTIDEINDELGGWFWRGMGEPLGFTNPQLTGKQKVVVNNIIKKAIKELEDNVKENSSKFTTLRKTPLTEQQILAGNTEAKPKARQPLGRVATMGDIAVGFQDEQKAVSLEDKKREMADFLKSKYKDKFGNSYVPAGFESIFRQLNPEANLQIKETPYGPMMWDGKEWKQVQMQKGNSQSIKEMRDASRGLVGSFDAQGNIRPTEIIPNSGVYIGGIFTGTDARYDKYLDEVTDLIEARNAATELEKINNTFGSSIFPTLKGRADVLVSRLKAGLRTDIVGVGTVSNYEQQLIENVIAKPQDFWRLKAADRMRLIEVLKAVEYGIKSKSTAFGLTVHIKDTSKNAQTEQELRQRLLQSGQLK